MASPWTSLAQFYRSLFHVLKAPQVWLFVGIGNLLMFPAAATFYAFELSENPAVDSYFDAIWWAFATVTTVGYGDITPITDQGRMIAIFLMVGGATCFVGFTAVFIPLFMAEFTKDFLQDEDQNMILIEKRLSTIEEILRKISVRDLP